MSLDGWVRQQSEQSLLIARQGSQRVLLAAYNDFETSADKTGLATSSPINGVGLSWPSRTVVLPAPSSPFAQMLGDPWLAADAGTQTTVYYSAMGELSSLPPGSDGGKRVGIARSDDGGVNFNGYPEVFKQVTTTCGNMVATDKPSMDVSSDGREVWIAYVCRSPVQEVHVAHSTNSGDTWSDHVVSSGTTSRDPAPIVKRDLLLSNAVYVMWQADTSTDRVLWFAASYDSGTTWSASDQHQAVNEPSMDPPFDAFNGTRAENGIHFWFEIDPGNYHCVLAYDVNGGIKFTGSADGIKWDPPVVVAADSTSDRFQPILRASPTELAIAYYAQPASGAANTTTWARISSNHGASWTAFGQLSQCSVGNCSSGTFRTDGFEACIQDPKMRAYFGDYIGLSPMLAPGQSNDVLTHRFYAVWADSRPTGGGAACPVQDAFQAIHQHSVGQLFGP